MSAKRPKFDREIRVYGSELIKRVRYDHNTWTLDVRLASGESYRYREVAPSAFAKLVTGDSPGKTFNESIKRNQFTTRARRATKIRNW